MAQPLIHDSSIQVIPFLNFYISYNLLQFFYLQRQKFEISIQWLAKFSDRHFSWRMYGQFFYEPLYSDIKSKTSLKKYTYPISCFVFTVLSGDNIERDALFQLGHSLEALSLLFTEYMSDIDTVCRFHWRFFRLSTFRFSHFYKEKTFLDWNRVFYWPRIS